MQNPAAFLNGVRVLDFTQYLAGPTCTRMLVELGAEVIKVELAPYGDPTRASVPRKNNRSGYHVQQNRGKRSLCLNLSDPAGSALIRDMIPNIDVVVENYSPGVMARRGLDYESLSALNPQLVMASISGFGQTGSLSHKTSFDLIAQAVSGMMSVTGDPDGPPMFVGSGIADCSAGVHAFAGIGFALLRRAMTGVGAHIDVSMVESLFHMHESNVHGPSMEPGQFVSKRGGQHHPTLCPAGTFKAPQGWIVVLCTANQMPYLWNALGRTDLAEDPRFVSNAARLENLEEFVALVEIWMAGFESDAGVLAALEEHRVPCGPVLSPEDALTHPWFLERGAVRDVTDPRIGTFQIPGFPLHFNDYEPPTDLVAPNLGEANTELLTSLAGYDAARIAALVAEGVLFEKIVDNDRQEPEYVPQPTEYRLGRSGPWRGIDQGTAQEPVRSSAHGVDGEQAGHRRERYRRDRSTEALVSTDTLGGEGGRNVGPGIIGDHGIGVEHGRQELYPGSIAQT